MIDSSDLEGYEDAEEYMGISYIDQYSSSVIFSDAGFANLKSGPFAETYFELQGDRRVLESIGDGFEFISAEDSENGTCEINYRIFATFVVRIEASSEEEVNLICQKDLKNIVQLVEGSTDDVYEIVELSVKHIYADKWLGIEYRTLGSLISSTPKC